MKQQLEQRLEELRDQFESGQKMMNDLENQQMNLRNTLLRISGAIQVLEELKTAESGVEKIPVKTDKNPEIPAGQ
jgi:hypothetical protein